MNLLNYMRLHDIPSGNPCQYWTFASNGKIRVPQRPSSMATAYHTSVLPIEERRSVVLLWVVERYPLR
jgi:hypothetical protein